MNPILFIQFDSFWSWLFLILVIEAVILGISILLRKDSKPERKKLRKEHKDFSFPHKGKEYLIRDSKLLFSIDSSSNPLFIHYFVEFPDGKYFGIKFNDSSGEPDVNPHTLEEINDILEEKLETAREDLTRGVRIKKSGVVILVIFFVLFVLGMLFQMHTVYQGLLTKLELGRNMELVMGTMIN